VVDDKPENRELLVELLSPVGFEVQEAGNGEEAIAQWQHWSPHLIWMDIRMPVMDGYEAIRQIHRACQMAQKPLPVIIALTGSVFEEDRREALSLGCKDFVKKPFRTEVIFEKMEEYLGVRYLYSTSSTLSRFSASAQTEGYFLTPDKLSIMPTEWLAQLHHAATRMNSKLVLQLIEQIPEDAAPLKVALAQRVEEFCIEEIVELTQHHVSGADYYHPAE
jgi:CheY-like chemotaxis protein